MKKIIIAATFGIVAFSLYSFSISKDKDTHADEYESVVEDTTQQSINEEVHKKSEYIEGEKPLYIDDILVVNKEYGLPKDFIPNEGNLEAEVTEAFTEMKEDAKKDGLVINIRSGYRNYDIQQQLYNDYVRRDGEENAKRYSAVPGFSEHQTGLAIDITTEDRVTSIGPWFDETPQAKWIYENAYKYGFILRYPEGKEHITGYKAESWHYRYIGKEHSKNFNMNNLTLEEYLGIYK
ncbi:MAG: M15 family metallopeptidase [Paraclostridium sp.]